MVMADRRQVHREEAGCRDSLLLPRRRRREGLSLAAVMLALMSIGQRALASPPAPPAVAGSLPFNPPAATSSLAQHDWWTGLGLIVLGATIGVIACATFRVFEARNRPNAALRGWLTVWSVSAIICAVCRVGTTLPGIRPDGLLLLRIGQAGVGLLVGSGAMLARLLIEPPTAPSPVRRPATVLAMTAPLLGIAAACGALLPRDSAAIALNLLLLLGAGWTLWIGAVALWHSDSILRLCVIGWLPLIAVLGLDTRADSMPSLIQRTGLGLSLALAFQAIMFWVAALQRPFATPHHDGLAEARAAAPVELSLPSQRNSHVDALTGLMTRSAYMEALEDAPVGASLFVIDIDHLREINNSFGHRHGDALLLHLAHRLHQEVTAALAIARSAGDSFAIIAAPDQEATIAARLDALQGEPWNCAGRVLSLSVSIGQARRRPGHLPEEFRHQAEQALDESRRLGRGRRVCYSDALAIRHDREAEYLAEIPHAIARHELELFYQPIVDLRDGRILAEEALLRWRHPIRGLLTPASFQTLLNHHAWGPIVQDQVLSLALDHLARTHDVPGYLSVNFTGPQLRGASTARHILRRLEARDIPFHRLCVEVTESVALDLGIAEVIEALELLHTAGVRVALDDFGTGYASLQHLRLFPIDVIKIDRSFVCTTVHSENDADKIAHSIVSLGQSLDKLVIAEGVETDEQRRRLIEFGCRTGQGYLFSRPLLESELPPRGTRLPFLRDEPTSPQARRAAMIAASKS